MESERTRGPVTDQLTPGCVGCGEPVSAARCEHCGVAVAPGGWKLKRLLAKTPHSRVFLAEKDGRKVALKELLFALVPDAQQLEGFEREARMLKQLNHPSIPKLVESFREGSGIHTRLYLAQEFVPGASLLQELEDHRFSEPEVKSIARTMLETLEYLHGLSPRVIHRDIKPANIMRREDGSLALVDFGAARDLTRGHTHGSTLVGTFGYMPPEQLGGTVDLSSDLYALGASLLHLLSRRPPDELLKPGLELSFGEEINVSPRFRAWLEKMVARKPSDRFRTSRAAREALDDVGLLELKRPPVVQSTLPPAARPAWRMAAVVGVVFASMLASVVLLVGRAPRPMPVERPVAVQPVAVPAPPPVETEYRVPPGYEEVPAGSVSNAAPGARLMRKIPAPPPPPEQTIKRRPNGTITMSGTPEPQRPTELVPVPKVPVLAPFTLEKPFVARIEWSVPVKSGTCPTGAGSLNIDSVKAVPGQLQVWTQLSNGDAPPGCTTVFMELLDQRGVREPSRSTLLTSGSGTTAAMRRTDLTLPTNSQRVQLRFGPQSKPLAVIDVDLVKGTATRQ